MVHLNRIYTKTGDRGETSLGDGSRVPKTGQRVKAFGAVDELNASLGVVIALGALSESFRQRLLAIQNDLFDLGADLCLPETEESPEYTPLRVLDSQVERLEREIDEDTSQLEPLNSFILPGGGVGAALLHQARTVCRRAEIDVLALADQETVNGAVIRYLNRLSDLLFTMARRCNSEGRNDVLWVPGSNR
ncbi:MAG: cob(I)yrinic acid a,c-diamide adenosyltransferase [Planctomycetaceae bacterium]|nr:cob(I)yrinic acid a,c-diamide adenosyltransferase [Planctomycetaceae bacterium]